MITIFPTYEYLGYQVGIRHHYETVEITKIKSLAKEKWRFWPYFNRRKIYFDIYFIATKKALKCVKINYTWVLSNPDGKQVIKNDEGVVDLTSTNKARSVLNLGHFSVAGEFRLDITLSNDKTDEVFKLETFDFSVSDFGKFTFTLFQGAFLTIITVILTIFLTTCITGTPN